MHAFIEAMLSFKNVKIIFYLRVKRKMCCGCLQHCLLDTTISYLFDNVYRVIGTKNLLILSHPTYLEDVLSLFTTSVQLDTRTIISQGNSSDLVTLTKIYGYPSLVHSNYPEINADIISELTDHDDPYVREYAYWSLYHGGSSEKYLLSSPDDDIGTRKWQIAIQFESEDFDFITSILRPLSRNPDYIDKEVKEGILKGLGKIQYSEQFVPYIYGWYALENIELICLLIVDYMLINCTKNRSDGTFFEALNDALTEDNSLSSYIKKR